MTFKTAIVDITDEPTPLTDGGATHDIEVTLVSTESAFLGGDDVTTDDGRELADGDNPWSTTVRAGEILYAVAETTAQVKTFRAGA